MDQHECARLETQAGQPLNLQGVHISGDLRGLMFEACVEQRFCNPSDTNLEVIYSFPLPYGAVLLGVDILLGERRLTGMVVEKKAAEARYEEAIADGNAAIMLEKNHDHSYTLNLGNLAAGERCVVTLRYAQILRFEQRGLRLLVPTVIAPRYGDAMQDGGLMPHQAPSHSLCADYPLELEIRLHGELALARVSSPSHVVSVAPGRTAAKNLLTISLLHRASLDRDFVLVVDQLAHDSVAVAARDCVEPENLAVLTSFCPRSRTRSDASLAAKILVDCSGSMAGDSINAAKRALQAIVLQLQAGDRFSLSRFGSTVEHRSRGLWKVAEATKLAAQRWVGGLEADLGGTEMESALFSTLASVRAVGSDILLVTDGEISAIDSTLKAAMLTKHRLFVVGIGSSPAEAHLHRLAEATGGACDFVAPGEAVEPAVLRMFARLRSPLFAELSLDWPAGVTPEWVSPLPSSVFDGDTVSVFALLRQSLAGPVRLLGKCSADEAPQEIGCAALRGELEAGDTLSRMAASTRFGALANGGLASEANAAAQLAVSYQLITSQTNFLLIHERLDEDRPSSMPELQKIAHMLPAGWGGVGSVKFSLRSVPRHLRRHEVTEAAGRAGALSPSMPVPAVFRTAREPSASFGNVDAGAGNDTGIRFCLADHRVEIPAYLRQSDWIADRKNPWYWADLRHYAGLTPLGLCKWLRHMPAREWPTNYAGLRRIGLGAGVVDWLELAMVTCKEKQPLEAVLVEAFLKLMSSQKVHDSLVKPEGFVSIFKALEETLGQPFTVSPAVDSYSLNPLVEAIAVALEGMTAAAWPDRVFALSCDIEA